MCMFNQQQVGSRTAKIILPLHFDELGVDILIFIIVEAGIEWLGLTGSLQILSQLPGLEDRLDLGNEGRDFRPEVREPLGGFQVVKELLTDEIPECLVGPELVLDHPCGITLFNPDLARLHRHSSRCSSQ